MIETKNDTYIDDLVVQTDYQIPKHFRNIFNENSEVFGTVKYENLFEKNDNEHENDGHYWANILIGTIILVIITF